MPLTSRARTLLKWTSHLGTTYRASRRKTLGWQWWGYAYWLACLLLFDRMVLGCCLPSCSNQLKKTGGKDSCQSNGAHTVSKLCDCLSELKSEEQRKHLLEKYHLEFCDILPFGKHLAFLSNAAKCEENLKKIVEADCGVLHDNSKFQEIIQRIDCRQRYSVRWTCKDCKVAYKEFLCTSKVLPLMLSETKHACKIGSCKKVLQRCPYFLPNSESQWSGQSVFECNLDNTDQSGCINVSTPSKEQNHNTNGS